MNRIAYFFIPALVYLVFMIAKNEIRESERVMDENNILIRQPKIYLWVGIICGTFFLGIEIFMTMKPNESSELWVHLVFNFFALFGTLLAVYCLRWEVKIEQNQITYSGFSRRKVRFTVDEITKVKHIVNRKIIVYRGAKKQFSVDVNSKGFRILVSRLENEKTIHFEY